MLIPIAAAQAETKAKNSRFLAEIIPVSSVEEAKELWKFRKENYDNGGHIVYAFIIGPQQNISGCSDDGEPSGTAGRPVLAVLTGSGVTNAMITVARWFGGTKLGTGGLVHAYGEAAKAAIDAGSYTELVSMSKCSFTIPYSSYARCRTFLDSLKFISGTENFSTEVEITGTLRSADKDILLAYLTDLGNGTTDCSFTDDGN